MYLYHAFTGFGIVFFILCKLALHYYPDGSQQRPLGLDSLLISLCSYLR
ncbi:MAG: hypothetical protein IPM91_14740 [Bacteroidetes bacterium]|nr:hypothetical protein [Bacteroidota bacterium]